MPPEAMEQPKDFTPVLVSDERLGNIVADLCVTPDRNGEPDWDPSIVQACTDGGKKVRDLYEADRAKCREIIRRLQGALKKADQALQMSRSSYENRGDYFDGWCSQALPEVSAAIDEANAFLQ